VCLLVDEQIQEEVGRGQSEQVIQLGGGFDGQFEEGAHRDFLKAWSFLFVVDVRTQKED
jgi:hypothetical protein